MDSLGSERVNNDILRSYRGAGETGRDRRGAREGVKNRGGCRPGSLIGQGGRRPPQLSLLDRTAKEGWQGPGGPFPAVGSGRVEEDRREEGKDREWSHPTEMSPSHVGQAAASSPVTQTRWCLMQTKKGSTSLLQNFT